MVLIGNKAAHGVYHMARGVSDNYEVHQHGASRILELLQTNLGGSLMSGCAVAIWPSRHTKEDKQTQGQAEDESSAPIKLPPRHARVLASIAAVKACGGAQPQPVAPAHLPAPGIRRRRSRPLSRQTDGL